MKKNFNQENIDHVQYLCDKDHKIKNTLDWLRFYGVDFIVVNNDTVLESEYLIEYVYCKCPMSYDLYLVRKRCLENFSKLANLASTYETPIEKLEHIVQLTAI
jgi:hypothetical protein